MSKFLGFIILICVLNIHQISSQNEESLFSNFYNIRDKIVGLEEDNYQKIHNQNMKDAVTLVLGSERKTIWRPKIPYPDFLDPSVTVLSSDKLPSERFMPTIGNGYLATVAHSDTVYRCDLFNGYNVTSHRARIPATSSVQITNISYPDEFIRKYSLDMGRGMYIEEYNGEYVQINLKMYAHRMYMSLMITEITVKTDVNLTLKLHTNKDLSSKDLVILQNETQDIFQAMRAKVVDPEYNSTEKEVWLYSNIVTDEISIIMRLWTSLVFLCPVFSQFFQINVPRIYGYGIPLIGMNSYMKGELERLHVEEWEKDWSNGRIDLQGNRELAQVTYSSLYYLMSAILPKHNNIEFPFPFVGLSPGDLAHGSKGGDYEGHVFWDQETWMYPPILMLQSDWAKVILDSRSRTLDAAKTIASRKGYKGAMYPWESAETGYDVCPGYVYSLYEEHITGDIAFAVKQYYVMTRDEKYIMYGGGGELINQIAEFWESRVFYNDHTSQYEIFDVMPPDEYHVPVNNSAYINAIAQISLLATREILPLVNISSDKFVSIGNKMYIPFNETRQWHPEYDRYAEGTVVKQADVILLGFPLMVNMTPEVTPGGPAMTWGMFAIGWLELGEFNKSQELFEKQLLNVNKPFNVWSELPSGSGAVNFITGMGGFLQSIIFGYGGFRIAPDYSGLYFNGNLPPGITCFNITGLDYIKGSFDFSFWEDGMSITQIKSGLYNFGIAQLAQRYPLVVGQT